MTDLYDVTCDGPGPHDPPDGILGTADRIVEGMRCNAPACQPPIDDDPPAPSATAVDDAFAKVSTATTVAGLRNAVLGALEALRASD